MGAGVGGDGKWQKKKIEKLRVRRNEGGKEQKNLSGMSNIFFLLLTPPVGCSDYF